MRTCVFCAGLCAQISDRAHVSLEHSLLLNGRTKLLTAANPNIADYQCMVLCECVCQLMEAGGLGFKFPMLLFVLCFLLKRPKHENFGSDFLTPSKQSGWTTCGMEGKLIFVTFETLSSHLQQALNISSAYALQIFYASVETAQLIVV